MILNLRKGNTTTLTDAGATTVTSSNPKIVSVTPLPATATAGKGYRLIAVDAGDCTLNIKGTLGLVINVKVWSDGPHKDHKK